MLEKKLKSAKAKFIACKKKAIAYAIFKYLELTLPPPPGKEFKITSVTPEENSCDQTVFDYKEYSSCKSVFYKYNEIYGNK